MQMLDLKGFNRKVLCLSYNYVDHVPNQLASQPFQHFVNNGQI